MFKMLQFDFSFETLPKAVGGGHWEHEALRGTLLSCSISVGDWAERGSQEVSYVGKPHWFSS